MGWEVALIIYFGVGVVVGFMEATSKTVRNTALYYAKDKNLSQKSFLKLHVILAVIVFITILFLWLPNIFLNLLAVKDGE